MWESSDLSVIFWFCSEKTNEEFLKKKMKTLYHDNAIYWWNLTGKYRLTTNLTTIFQELVVKFVFQYETVKANIKPWRWNRVVNGWGRKLKYTLRNQRIYHQRNWFHIAPAPRPALTWYTLLFLLPPSPGGSLQQSDAYSRADFPYQMSMFSWQGVALTESLTSAIR